MPKFQVDVAINADGVKPGAEAAANAVKTTSAAVEANTKATKENQSAKTASGDAERRQSEAGSAALRVYQQQTASLVELYRATQQGAGALREYLQLQEQLAAVEAQVVALQQQRAALAEVRAQQAALAEGTLLARGFAAALETVGQALKYIVVYGALIGLISDLRDAMKAAIAFEDSLTRLRTLVGLTAQEVAGFRTAIAGISIATGQSADANAKALFAITSAGVRGEEALRALQASAEGAAIGLGDQTTVARAAVSAMVAYGAGNLSAKEALDVLIATAREGNTTVEDIAGSFGRVTAIAASVGVKFADLGAAVASFTRVGVSAQEAVTGLRGVLSALELKEAKTADAALKTVGLSVQQLRKNIQDQGLAQALVDLVGRFHGNNDEIAKIVPNIRALAELLSNAKSQAGEYVAIQDRVNASIGHATDEAFKLEQQNPAFVFRQLGVALSEAGRQILSGFLPTMVEVAKAIRESIHSDDIRTWGAVFVATFNGAVLTVRILVEVLRNFPVALAVYVGWTLLASASQVTAATTARQWGAALAWVEAQMASLDAVIAANPWGALLVAAAALLVVISRVAEAQRAADQAFLDDVARANEDSVAIAKLTADYKELHRARAAAGGGPSQFVPTGGDDTFLVKLKGISDAYQRATAAAGSDTTAQGAAKIARDRDTQALQAHEQALLDDSRAAIANKEILLQTETAAHDAAVKRLQQAAALAQKGGVNVANPTYQPGEWSAPYNGLVAGLRSAKEEEQGLANSMKATAEQVRAGNAVLVARQVALDRSKVAGQQQGDEVEKSSQKLANAEREVENSIRLHQIEAQDKLALAAAELKGSEAVRQATLVAAANRAVEEARQKLAKAGGTLSAEQEARIRGVAAALSDANLKSQQNQALWQSGISTAQSVIDAQAKVRDAIAGNSDASTRAAAVFQVEQEIERRFPDIHSTNAQKLRDESAARTEAAIATQHLVVALNQERQDSINARTAAAALRDAVVRSTAASHDLSLQLEIEKRQREQNAAAGTLEGEAIRVKTTRMQEEIDASARLTAVQEQLNHFADERAKAAADLADLRTRLDLEARLPPAMAKVAVALATIRSASEQVAIAEEVRQAVLKETIGLSQKDALFAALQIEARIRGQHEETASLKEQGVLIQANADKQKVFNDQLTATASTLEDSIASAMVGISVDWRQVLQDLLKQWILTLIKMQEVAAGARLAQLATGSSSGTSGVGPVAGADQYASLLHSAYGGGFSGFVGSAGTAGVAGSGSGAAGLFSGTGALGAVGSVVAWVAVLAAFAIAVNKLNAHIQKTGESVINLGHALDITTPVQDDHVASLVATGRQLAEQIKQFFIGFGGIFTSLDSTIGVKRRGQGSNTQWKVYADGIVTSFGKDMQAAFEFAEIEAIKHSSSIGLDPLVKAAVKDYAGKSLDEFKAQVEFAQRIATQNLPGISGQLSSAATQYFADLHQAQVQFAGDLTALDAAVQSIVKKFADTVQGIKNSALGIDTSTSDFLAGIVAFQQQMAKTSGTVAAEIQQRIDDTLKQIAAMGSGPRRGLKGGVDLDASAQADWDAQLATLRHNVAEYKAELAKIPKALSDSEVNMAVFNSLYQYLQGSKKYAQQAAEYAQLKVQIEFESIKLQLIALGKWEQFAGMWQDALNAAQKQAATAARAHPNAGSGASSAANDAQSLADALHQAAEAKLPPLQQQIAQLNDKWDATLKLAHGNAVAIEAVNKARASEIALAEKQARDSARQSYAQFVNANLVPGGAFLNSLTAIDTTATDLIGKFNDLAKAGAISSTELKNSTANIQAAAQAAKQAAANAVASDVFGQMYQLLGDDKAAAQLKYDLTLAELQAKRAELAIAVAQGLLAADVLGKFDELYNKIVAAGPALFMPHSSAGGQQSAADAVAQDRAMVAGVPYISTSDALARLQEIEASALSPFAAAIKKVNDEFVSLRITLGNTDRVQRAYNLAIQQVVDQFLKPIRDLQATLLQSAQSPLKPIEKLNDAQQQFLAAAQAISAGDLSMLDQLPQLAQTLLQDAQTALPTGSEAYRSLFAEVQQVLASVLAQYGAPAGDGSGADAGAGGGGLGTAAAPMQVNLTPVVDQLAAGNADQLSILRDIRTNTFGTQQEVARVGQRLNQPISVFREVG